MDTSVATWLNRVAQHSGARQLTIFGAKYLMVVPIAIALFLAVRSLIRRDSRALASLVVAAAGTGLAVVANMIATNVWFRNRPYNALPQVQALIARAHESSFFSDHTIAVTGAAVGAFLVSRRWGIVAIVSAALIAIARVAAGAHYPTDVLAAAAITVALIAMLLPLRGPLTRLIDGALKKVVRAPSTASNQ